jgi:hypothetical protein
MEEDEREEEEKVREVGKRMRSTQLRTMGISIKRREEEKFETRQNTENMINGCI